MFYINVFCATTCNLYYFSQFFFIIIIKTMAAYIKVSLLNTTAEACDKQNKKSCIVYFTDSEPALDYYNLKIVSKRTCAKDCSFCMSALSNNVRSGRFKANILVRCVSEK